MRLLVWRLILVLACAGMGYALGANGAFAQTPASAAGPTGAVRGTLIDPEKVVVSNIETTATLKNKATGQAFTGPVVKGVFDISGLPPGDYDFDIPIPCCMYAGIHAKTITVAAGQTVRFDVDVAWGMNLGTIGDDPGALGADLRAKTKTPNAKAPRLKDGRPDLSGTWLNIMDPTAGFGPRIPMQPWAQAMQQQLIRELGPAAANDAGAFCFPSNATPDRVLFPYEFIQGEKKIVQLTEFVTPQQRVIYMDGRKHPPADSWNPAWYGHSVGHWEGDTLIIDTIGFNEVVAGYAIHSEKLHVVEKIRRPTYGRLEIDITAEDPDAWTGPITQKVVAGLAEGEDVQEFLCTEANKDHPSSLWKGRPDGKINPGSGGPGPGPRPPAP